MKGVVSAVSFIAAKLFSEVRAVMKKYDLQSSIIGWRSSDNGSVRVAVGRTNINACLKAASHNAIDGEILLFNPPGSRVALCLEEESYVLNEAGTFLMPPYPELAIEQALTADCTFAANPIALFATAPGWWRPYTGRSLNESGFEGDRRVGLYRLSERRDPATGSAIHWTNDSVSSKPDSVGGVLGLSYVVSKANERMNRTDGMISIIENRPEESVHRHPQVSKYEPANSMLGLFELYIVLSGKLGIALFDAGGYSLTYHLIEEGEAVRIDPEEVHAVLATSNRFQYLCVQMPSCYHYPFNHNKHQFFRVSEISSKAGYEIADLLKLEKPGEYEMDARADRSGEAERLFL